MKIYYIYHSGFAVETENYKMIFDYYKETGYNIGEFNLESFLSGDKKVVVFSSHVHGDHFNPEILNWREINPDITYILSDDIKVKEKTSSIYMVHEGDTLDIDGINIKVFGSTDAGVSFYVGCDGETLFHAGDLNWWYWSDDTPEEEKYMRDLYMEKMDRIIDENLQIDYLFYPVDPRLENFSFLGVKYFIDSVRVKNIIPMHFWNNFNIIKDLEKELKDRKEKVIVYEKNMMKIV